MKPILIISGPTAVGKSHIGLEIAQRCKCDLISVDSVQLYRGFDIGSAKPSKEEQELVKHHFIDVLSPLERYSSYDYKQACTALINSGQCGTFPMLVGGTAFYIESLVKSLDFPTNGDDELRKELWAYHKEYGGDALHERLRCLDAESAERIHKNNVVRVIRAIEIALCGGKMSVGGKRKTEIPYVLFQLNLDRQELYQRIDDRVDMMLDVGLVEEVESLYREYNDKTLQPFQAIGYKEIINYLSGASTLREAAEEIKKNTKNYAKRQLTFLKRLDGYLIDATLPSKEICSHICEKYSQIRENAE